MCHVKMFETKVIKTESKKWVIPNIRSEKFAIMDIDRHYEDGSRWMVTSDYINFLEGIYFNISDVRNVVYNSTDNILYLHFISPIKDGRNHFETIRFSIKFEHIIMTFFESNCSIAFEQTSKLDGCVSLQRLFSAFKDLSNLKDKYAVIDLAGNAWQVDYLCNFYRHEDRRKYFHALTDGPIFI